MLEDEIERGVHIEEAEPQDIGDKILRNGFACRGFIDPQRQPRKIE